MRPPLPWGQGHRAASPNSLLCVCPPLSPPQIRRRRPTPANLVLSSDQSSPGGSSRVLSPWDTAVTFKSASVTGPTSHVAFGDGVRPSWQLCHNLPARPPPSLSCVVLSVP
uniref:Uncharacterized protein n=1 Tax=Otus sunia TaxID=257818 RepID=A0A8C8AEY1_9STRI